MNKLFKYLFIIVFFTSCHQQKGVIKIQSAHYELKDHKEDDSVKVIIEPYRKKLEGEMNVVIAQNDEPLLKEGLVPPLANFVLQAINHHAHKMHPQIGNDFIGVINRGGMRNSLPGGNITVENIFELMPFDNELVLLKIKGSKVKAMTESFAKDRRLITWNLSFGISGEKVSPVKVGGKLLDENTDYNVVVSDYLANGGDESSFFASPVYYENSGVKLRDAIIDYCKDLTRENKHIIPYKDERIKTDE